MAKLIDLTGETFGRLTVIGYAGKDKRGGAMWNAFAIVKRLALFAVKI